MKYQEQENYKLLTLSYKQVREFKHDIENKFLVLNDMLKNDDGLNDDDEIKMGFNPNNSDSDNNGILDGDEIIEQEISKDVISHDDTISAISVNIRTSGNLEKNLTIESVYNVDLLSTDVVGLIGDPFKFEVTISFESADITFTINQSKLNDTNFDDLWVLWYDKYNQRFIECTSENDFVTTKHFSKYMVVNKKEWYRVWEESLKNIANITKGDFFKVTYADELVDVISNSDIDDLKNNPDFDLLWKMDSDDDSIPDLIEIYGLRPNGKPLGTNTFG
jgi:hypothetical protein